jgi:hypothetical protein
MPTTERKTWSYLGGPLDGKTVELHYMPALGELRVPSLSGGGNLVIHRYLVSEERSSEGFPFLKYEGVVE